jgi:hypothetical protein
MTKKANETDRPRLKTWPTAVAEAALQQDVQLPEIAQQGMGSVLWRSAGGDRLVSFKRRFVAPSAAEDAGVEWTLWSEGDAVPTPVVTFRLPLRPAPNGAQFIVSILKGWLLDHWTADKAKAEADQSVDVKIS